MNRILLFLTLAFVSLVGVVKGPEARQKWAFRIKSRMNEKKQQLEQKKMMRSGAILLDQVELDAFHKA